MYREIISESDLPFFRGTDQEFADKEAVQNEERGIRSANPRDASVPGGQRLKADSYSSRLLKYIPAEVIALYVALEGALKSANMAGTPLHWAIFSFCAVATVLYLWRVQKVSKRYQIALSAIAFCVWIFSLGGPFAGLSWYRPIYGALLLPSFTFIIPVFSERRKRNAGRRKGRRA
jgi:hypothetical protein